MFRNYVLTNIRSLWKNKSHSLINVIGISLGISCALIIFTIVRFENSFDTYHPDADRTYRVVVAYNGNGENSLSSGLPYPVAEAMRNDFNDVAYSTITDSNSGDPVLGIEKKEGARELFKESNTTFADPDYFKIFKYDWIEGNPQDGLAREKTVVLAESVARKFFGDVSALNRVISYNGKYDLTVSGVIKDPPQNTDFPFTVIISNRLGADKHSRDTWLSSSGSINCYIQLKQGVSQTGFQNKMKGWHMKYFGGGSEEEGKARTYSLQPLADVHFDQRFSNYKKTTSSESLFALSLIGALLLLTACINFINLNTVLISNRSREVGVRKVMGSGKLNLVLQFLGETLAITLIAMIISLSVIPIALLNISPLLGYQLEFHPLSDPLVTVFIFTIPILVTLFAGLYPALSLASFQPIQALKNKAYNTNGGLNFRRALIGFQLLISQALVISTIIIIQQMDYFSSQPLGLNSNALVEFDLPEQDSDLKSLKERISSIPGIEAVTFSNTGATSGNYWGGGFEATVKGTIVKADAQFKFVDVDFLKTYQIQLLTGDNIADADSSNGFIINEAFLRALGLQRPEDAIGVPVTYWGSNKGFITGVVSDFHSTSLHESIEPVMMIARPGFYHKAAIKLQTKDALTVMALIESEWKTTYPQYVFQYGFLDDLIDNFYQEERRTSKLISLFAGISVVIGSIGLLGLVSFMVRRRVKEVGIRKTLGASVPGIMILFSKEFVVILFISFLAAAPLSAFIMQQWLNKFAFHITPGILTFAAGALLSLLVVMGTVGLISFRAAAANPVHSLRDE